MSAQHTPGPWSADEWAPGWTVSAPDSHYSVCHMEDCNNAEANARLIAAAPDLLALLEELIDIEGPQPGHVMWYNKARAVIAKAKGEA